MKSPENNGPPGDLPGLMYGPLCDQNWHSKSISTAGLHWSYAMNVPVVHVCLLFKYQNLTFSKGVSFD